VKDRTLPFGRSFTVTNLTMKAHDNRHFPTRQSQLATEMDLWIIFHGKTLVAGEINSLITDVEYLPGRTSMRSANFVELTLSSGQKYKIEVKRGKPIMHSEKLIEATL
jgi:hypothetical protein